MSTPFWDATITQPLISDDYLVGIFNAGEDILPGDLTYFSGAYTVSRTNGTLNTVAGIALTAAKSGKKVTVILRGICRARASGAIAAGAPVESDSDGEIQSGATYKIGNAVEPAYNADDVIVIVLRV